MGKTLLVVVRQIRKVVLVLNPGLGFFKCCVVIAC